MIMNILKNIQNLTGFIIGNYSLFVYLYFSFKNPKHACIKAFGGRASYK